jgi:hydrogenase-4 component F
MLPSTVPLPWILVLLPLAGAAVLAALPSARVAALGNLGVSAVSFVLALLLFGQPQGEQSWLRLDALNLPLVVLSFLIGLAATVFLAGGAPEGRGRAWHGGIQLLIGAQVLALLSGNMGLTAMALGGAVVAAALMVAAQGTVPACRAAWKMLLLCGTGIGLALFGSILLHLAAQPFGPPGGVAEQSDPGLLSLAFVFLLVGFGSLAGLVPLHAWLPDAEAEGPPALPALLSVLLPNAALLAVLRAKAAIGASPGAVPPGPFLLALGLVSVLLAGLALWRRGDAGRFFAWASIGQIGLATFAFGLGGAAANLAGLLLMLGHALGKGAVAFGIAHAAQARGRRGIADMGGLCASHPALGWALALAIAALAGMPPFALFAGAFLLLTEIAARGWWALLLPLGLGLLGVVAAMIAGLQELCFGAAAAEGPRRRGGWSRAEALALGPLWLLLVVALVLGVALPGPLAALLAEAAGIPG